MSIKEALVKYNDMVAKATTLDAECNNHGHRLHFMQVAGSYKDKLLNKTREEIYTIGKIKISVYFSENSTFAEFLRTPIKPTYEAVICQCRSQWAGTYCDIPILKMDKNTGIDDKMGQENMRSKFNYFFF